MRAILIMWVRLMAMLAIAFVLFLEMAAPGFYDDLDAMVGPAPIDVIASR